MMCQTFICNKTVQLIFHLQKINDFCKEVTDFNEETTETTTDFNEFNEKDLNEIAKNAKNELFPSHSKNESECECNKFSHQKRL